MKTGIDFKIMMDPQKYGYKECGHCNGYGSSFKDPEGVNQCTKCGGSGLTMMTIDETIIVSDQEICPEGTCHDITVVLGDRKNYRYRYWPEDELEDREVNDANSHPRSPGPNLS